MTTRSRSGLTLLEVAVSAIVLGAVLTTVTQVIQWSAAEHRAAQRKRCALEAATTILDRLTVRDWSAITPESAAAIRLPAEATRFLVDPQLVVTVAAGADQNQSPPAKRISVEVTWANRAGGQKDRVRLATWVFRRKAVKGTDK